MSDTETTARRVTIIDGLGENEREFRGENCANEEDDEPKVSIDRDEYNDGLKILGRTTTPDAWLVVTYEDDDGETYVESGPVEKAGYTTNNIIVTYENVK